MLLLPPSITCGCESGKEGGTGEVGVTLDLSSDGFWRVETAGTASWKGLDGVVLLASSLSLGKASTQSISLRAREFISGPIVPCSNALWARWRWPIASAVQLDGCIMQQESP